MKQYKCQYPDCETISTIRSKVKNKDSEYYGLYVCNYHASQLRPRKVSEKTQRTQKARKEQRSDYPEFYQRHILQAEGSRCLECNKRLYGNSSSNIVHILAKSLSPEVATLDENIIYLCGIYSENQCHSLFDSSMEKRSQMKCFPETLERYKLMRDKIKNISHEVLFYESLI